MFRPTFSQDMDQIRAEREASVEPDRGEWAEIFEALKEYGIDLEALQRGTDSERVLEVLRSTLANVISPPAKSSSLREAEVIGLLIGFPGLVSMGHVAKRHGVGKAAISYQVNEMRERFNLPPSHYMKSEASRESYRKSNVRKRKAIACK